MKKIVALVLLLFLLSGCEQHQNENKKTSVDEINFQLKSVEEIINKNSNFKAVDDLIIQLPRNIENVYTFVTSYSPRQNNKDFHDDFINMLDYLFPEHEMKSDYFIYYGKNSFLEQNDEGKRIKDLNKVEDKYDEIITDEEDVHHLIYDESWYGLTEWNNPVCAEFTSPLCNDLSRFNKGIATGMIGILPSYGRYPSLESFSPLIYFDVIGEYSPESTERFKLLDKEISIKEAVNFFENYVNNLPISIESVIDMKVVSVSVLKLNDNANAYFFNTTKNYKGINFDTIKSGQSHSNFDKYSFVLGEGLMVKSNDVDYAYGIYRSQIISDIKEFSEIISFNSACEIVSSSLTSSVEFDVKKVELIYCEEAVEIFDATVEEYRKVTAPTWKFTLYNPNDKLTYVCYVDAVDGENFRYYTTKS